MPTVGRGAKRTSGSCRRNGRRRTRSPRRMGVKKDNKGQLVDGPRDKWKPDLKVVKATIRFLEQTGRLTYRHQALEA
jgi:hypothetical protein